MFEVFKSFLLESSPDPGFPFMSERLRGLTILEMSGMDFL